MTSEQRCDRTIIHHAKSVLLHIEHCTGCMQETLRLSAYRCRIPISVSHLHFSIYLAAIGIL